MATLELPNIVHAEELRPIVDAIPPEYLAAYLEGLTQTVLAHTITKAA